MSDLTGDMMLPIDQLARVNIRSPDPVPGIHIKELLDADGFPEIQFTERERPDVVFDENVLAETFLELTLQRDVMQVETWCEQDDPVPRLDHPVHGDAESDDISFRAVVQCYVERDDGVDELFVRVKPLVMPCLVEQFPMDVRDDPM